jgi:type IV pilus assembly protein PilN
VKPIHLNLASRPYRDYRPVYAVVVILSLLTAFLMLNNVETYYRYIHETQATRAQIAKVEEQAAKERQLEEAAKQRLQGLDLKKLDQKTKFINAKLAERAFSWSNLLDELESILAADVRLTSVSPAFSNEGPVNLSLNFQAKTSEGMIKTIDRMNADPQFHDAFPTSESRNDDGTYTFVIMAQYLPVPANRMQTAKVAR